MIPVTPDTVLAAYRQGVFPMATAKNGPVAWYSFDPRGVLPLDEFHIPKSLAKRIRAGHFDISCDRDFAAVIDGCAGREQTWISKEIRATYVELHRRGLAHSVEAWDGEGLAGGLYGVHIDGAFMGESMFHRASDSSKACLVALVEHLRRQKFSLLDIQQVTPITGRFGGVYVSRDEYLRRLRRAFQKPVPWGTFTFSFLR